MRTFLFAFSLLIILCNCTDSNVTVDDVKVSGEANSIDKKDKRLVSYPCDEEGFYGFKNIAGDVAIPCKYTMAFTDTLVHYGIVMTQAKKCMTIDSKGKELYEVYWFDNGPDYPAEGLFRYKENGNVGFADETTGKKKIKAEYSFALPFSEGLAAFCIGGKSVSDGEHSSWQGGKWGYIDKTGKVVIQASFDNALPFSDGEASVMKDGHEYTIGRSGKVLD